VAFEGSRIEVWTEEEGFLFKGFLVFCFTLMCCDIMNNSQATHLEAISVWDFFTHDCT
jgi:hypothetical protein